MLFKLNKDLLIKTKNKMKKLNAEYESMSKENRERELNIRKSIHGKSKKFDDNRVKMDKHFDIIRNK